MNEGTKFFSFPIMPWSNVSMLNSIYMPRNHHMVEYSISFEIEAQAKPPITFSDEYSLDQKKKSSLPLLSLELCFTAVHSLKNM